MNLHQWRAWPANAIVNDGDWHCVDPSRAWVPSPELQSFPLPATGGEEQEARVIPGSIRLLQPNRLSESPASQNQKLTQEVCDDPLARRRRRFTLGRLVSKFGFRARKKKDEAQQWPPLYGLQRKVLPDEWKAYGHWARPRIGNVIVRNATPPPQPYNLSIKQIEQVMRSVQGPDGSARPERWISRLSHPALPPRPSLWGTPPPSIPSFPLLARHLQLNPFLEHRLMGVPPITFDIRFVLDSIILGETPTISSPSSSASSSSSSLQRNSRSPQSHPRHTPRTQYLMFEPDGPNGAQPATYPGISALTISALADEMTYHFPWPATAISADNSLPVTVQEVLNAVYVNFQEFMTREELDCLTDLRRGQVERAYRARVRDLPGVPPDDGIRRVDLLGDRCVFRGLEPVREGEGDEEGFVLFVGPPQ